MSKAKTKRKSTTRETDSTYLLKLVLYLIFGSQWVFLVDGGLTRQIPLPIGFVVGLLFAMHDHFQIDRKIEYAVLLVAMFIGFWANAGIYVTLL